MSKEKDVKKIVPSKLENLSYQIIYKYIGEHIPENVTPNQITLLGAISGGIGIVFALLSNFNRFLLIGTVCGILGHLICDDLDGYIARKRHMTSKAGGYFDLLTDILHITYLIIALSFAHVISFQIAICTVPVYALIIFTSMNSILHLNEFPFPRLGPIETHLFFVLICIIGMIFTRDFCIHLSVYCIRPTDLVLFLGAIPMYVEMIRLQVNLFKRLSQKDKEEQM